MNLMNGWLKRGRFVRANIGPVRAASAGPTMLQVPALVTVPNVEILEVGEDWETSTGIFTWDMEDLQSAIASQDDPSIRTPVIKLGHTDPRFDGQPSFGRLENLCLTNNEQTLTSDYTSMPGWLAACLESAYPRRSIEGWFDVTTRTGNEWPFVLTAIALLGEAYPAINTLEDIKAIWGGETPTLVPADEAAGVIASRETENGTFFVALREEDMRWKRRNEGAEPVAAASPVRAGVTVDDVRRTFYDTIGSEPGNFWWWIRAVMIDPAQIIVDDDEGGLYRIDYSVSDSAVIFGEPVPVEIEYVDVAASTGLAPDGTRVRIGSRYADAAASGRPERPPRDEGSQSPPASATVPTEQEGNGMQLSDEAIRSLGLDPATATEAQVLEAFAARAQGNGGDGGEGGGEGEGEGGEGGGTTTSPPSETTTTTTTTTDTPGGGETTTPNEGTTIPEGYVLVDAGAWQNVQHTSQAMAARLEQERIADRDRTIADAVRAGKVERARMEFWTAKWEADPDGTRQTLAALTPVLPVTELGEQGGETDPAIAEAYPSSWGPTVAASRKGTAGFVKVVND